MGNRVLYQPDTAGRVGKVFARSKNCQRGREKVDCSGSTCRTRNEKRSPPREGRRKRKARAITFAILRSLARYPSGPRERSAKPPFVGSNPTRASTVFPCILASFQSLVRKLYDE